MLNRIKQFFLAVTARLEAADEQFIKDHLNENEQKLFLRMAIPDQRHALNVAYTALKLSGNWRQARLDTKLLITSALLHDIGKQAGDISTVDKIITVLADAFVPRQAKRWGKKGKGGLIKNVRHAFYVYYNHPQRGAEMALQIGVDPLVAAIIDKHHQAPAGEESPELKIIRQADSLN